MTSELYLRSTDGLLKLEAPMKGKEKNKLFADAKLVIEQEALLLSKESPDALVQFVNLFCDKLPIMTPDQQREVKIAVLAEIEKVSEAESSPLQRILTQLTDVAVEARKSMLFSDLLQRCLQQLPALTTESSDSSHQGTVNTCFGDIKAIIKRNSSEPEPADLSDFIELVCQKMDLLSPGQLRALKAITNADLEKANDDASSSPLQKILARFEDPTIKEKFLKPVVPFPELLQGCIAHLEGISDQLESTDLSKKASDCFATVGTVIKRSSSVDAAPEDLTRFVELVCQKAKLLTSGQQRSMKISVLAEIEKATDATTSPLQPILAELADVSTEKSVAKKTFPELLERCVQHLETISAETANLPQEAGQCLSDLKALISRCSSEATDVDLTYFVQLVCQKMPLLTMKQQQSLKSSVVLEVEKASDAISSALQPVLTQLADVPLKIKTKSTSVSYPEQLTRCTEQLEVWCGDTGQEDRNQHFTNVTSLFPRSHNQPESMDFTRFTEMVCRKLSLFTSAQQRSLKAMVQTETTKVAVEGGISPLQPILAYIDSKQAANSDQSAPTTPSVRPSMAQGAQAANSPYPTPPSGHREPGPETWTRNPSQAFWRANNTAPLTLFMCS